MSIANLPLSSLENFDNDCWAGFAPSASDYSITISSEIVTYWENLFSKQLPPADTDLASYIALIERFPQFTREIRSRLFCTCGFVVIEGMPNNWLNDGRARSFYAWVCSLVGRLNYKHGPFYEVFDRGESNYTLTTRYSDTNLSHGFHTDGTGLNCSPDVVCLLCIRQAEVGGENHLSNAVDAHQRMLAFNHKQLALLYKPIIRDCTVQDGENLQQVLRGHAYPVFQWDRGNRGLVFRYMRRWIEVAYQRLEESVPNDIREAMDVLDECLAHPDNSITLKLNPGSILLLNNFQFAHDRSAFAETNPGNRFMLRAWLDVDFN